MPRITISEELEKKLKLTKKSNYLLKYDKGLQSTVAYLLTEYQQQKEIREQIFQLKRTIIGTMEKAAEKGTIKALKQMIHNIISL